MTKPQHEEFARRLATERHRLQLTQAEVARATEVSAATQIGYEQGQRSPPTQYTTRLRTLGFDVHYLMFGQSSADFASDTLNWHLAARVVAEIAAWCDAQGVVLDEVRLSEAARLLYNEHLRKPVAETLNAGRVLTLLADAPVQRLSKDGPAPEKERAP